MTSAHTQKNENSLVNLILMEFQYAQHFSFILHIPTFIRFIPYWTFSFAFASAKCRVLALGTTAKFTLCVAVFA